MALFPGDMNIGWGFGRYPQEELRVFKDEPECDPEGYHPDESPLTDPLLAVSELEQRVIALEERLRSLTIVVNEQVERFDNFLQGLLEALETYREKD